MLLACCGENRNWINPGPSLISEKQKSFILNDVTDSCTLFTKSWPEPNWLGLPTPNCKRVSSYYPNTNHQSKTKFSYTASPGHFNLWSNVIKAFHTCRLVSCGPWKESESFVGISRLVTFFQRDWSFSLCTEFLTLYTSNINSPYMKSNWSLSLNKQRKP